MDYKIHTYHLNDSGFVRIVFDIKTGICLCEALDIQLSDVFFRRDFKKYSLTINTLKMFLLRWVAILNWIILNLLDLRILLCLITILEF